MTTVSKKKKQQDLKDAELEKDQGGWSWGETNDSFQKTGKLTPETKNMERVHEDE